MGGPCSTHSEMGPAHENSVGVSKIKILGRHRCKWQIILKLIVRK
jgi:hypothetical protein